MGDHDQPVLHGRIFALVYPPSVSYAVQGMYALFVSSEEMYLCIDSYSSWITRYRDCNTPLELPAQASESIPGIQPACAKACTPFTPLLA